MRTLILALCAAALSSCATPQFRSISSGEIGCAPTDIAITNESIGATVHTWDASCKGRTFHCAMRVGPGANGHSCKEALP